MCHTWTDEQDLDDLLFPCYGLAAPQCWGGEIGHYWLVHVGDYGDGLDSFFPFALYLQPTLIVDASLILSARCLQFRKANATGQARIRGTFKDLITLHLY